MFDKYFKKNIYDINKIAFLYSFGKIMSKKIIPTIRKSIKQKVETANNDIKIDTKAVDTKAVDTKAVDTKAVDTKPVDNRPVDTKIVSGKKEIIIKKRVVEPESVSTNTSFSSEIYFIEPSDLPRDRKSPGILNYNDNLYSLLYTDLRNLSPKERGVHYLEKGIYEGRIATYRQLFSKIGPELYYHFDHKQYLKAYEDLQEIYTEKDRYALILHYINNGVSEMRKEFRAKNKLIPLINYWDSDDSEDESEE